MADEIGKRLLLLVALLIVSAAVHYSTPDPFADHKERERLAKRDEGPATAVNSYDARGLVASSGLLSQLPEAHRARYLLSAQSRTSGCGPESVEPITAVSQGLHQFIECGYAVLAPGLLPNLTEKRLAQESRTLPCDST